MNERPPSVRIAGVGLAALPLLLAACGAGNSHATPAATTAPAGTTHAVTLDTPDGRTRTAHVYVPGTLAAGRSSPLLVALHGGTGTGVQFERTSGFDDLAAANRFLVVYPDGVGTGADENQLRTWNGGVCCGAAVKKSVDDVTFLRALVQQLSAEYRIDPSRVFVTGHSNGMVMAYRLVCEAADVFVAAAGQAGTLGVDGCTPAAPVSFLHIHGAADVNIPIDGGRGKGISGAAFPSPRTSIRTLAAADSCPTTASTRVDAPATIETWEPCAGGTTVEFVTVAGAAHAWMGGAPARAGGPTPFAGYDSSAAVWSFLAAHPRR